MVEIETALKGIRVGSQQALNATAWNPTLRNRGCTTMGMNDNNDFEGGTSFVPGNRYYSVARDYLIGG
jgi:hypothetical protein